MVIGKADDAGEAEARIAEMRALAGGGAVSNDDTAEPTVFSCGPEKCEHVWDGPGIEWETGGASTCSKCGIDAMTLALWEGP